MINKKKTSFLVELIFLGLLVIYPMRHVNLGVDLMDGGYNYANFIFDGQEYMGSMWFFATWSANIFGSFLTKLPGGSTMLGMNIYTTLLISMMAVGAYLFCTRKMGLSKVLTFVGEMLALSLCWLPAAVLYTYLTYVFLLLGALFLYEGLSKDKKWYLVIAGICLGINVSVRFSNLPQMALILVVWFYAIINKKKLSKVLQETGFCILGYIAAMGVFMLVIAFRYGVEAYVAGVSQLFSMTEYATDYATDSMLWGMIGGYFKISYWLKRCVLAGGCAIIICLVLPRKWRRVKQVITIGCMMVLLWWLKKSGFFTPDYKSYYSVYYPCVLVLLMTMGLAIFRMVDATVDKKDRMQAMLVLLLVLISSLGSNNAIFSTMNNLFLIMPVFLNMLHQFIKEKKHILFWPFQAILVMCTLLLFVQALKFGWYYVYEEADGARDLSVKISGIPRLDGIRTGEQKAENLEGLYAYLQDNDLLNQECILFGDIPGISYYMDLVPAINIWSDLRSYSTQTMFKDMERMEEESRQQEEFPLIIIHKKYWSYCDKGETEQLPQDPAVREKLDCICGFATKYEYSPWYNNEGFVVLGR